ncbi:NADH:flavin oxidoreductase [Syncephalis pseudoplumigaleata]|uniref:NADH:flavin oxidoreductase n=1 Tax=Syncephalis pseudoplumigaleata TaxID=1712513 RepID=A0A4P9Z3I3_9FUNG|nr:NADH:flavin oxidoreductase [Syncephalis pseudoplumigaleata]|eukprot:RKP26572.1 NADH:flavin oxidoreductase [Syncephalis pseudoplumigaleata]
MSAHSLFAPLQVGAWSLKHRIALAPLTRKRATKASYRQHHVQYALASEYYAQRATPGGLLITEATGISDTSLGMDTAPGIWTAEHRDAWIDVVQAVKRKAPDATVVMQLWHRGRACHSDFLPGKQLPVAPSAIAISDATVANERGELVPYEVPRALEAGEIPGIVEDYRQACHHAKAAGFDGVEVHAANGYLINQFLESGTNRRTDAYGGSIANRIRFCVQVVQAAVDVFGADRVGVRFSPYGTFGDMHDDDPIALYTEAIRAVTRLHVAYVHLVEPRVAGAGDAQHPASTPSIEPLADAVRAGGAVLIRAGGYTPTTAHDTVAAGRSDLIAFGRPFIANPDLPARILHGWPLTPYNRATFYTPGPEGYIDYPVFSKAS